MLKSHAEEFMRDVGERPLAGALASLLAATYLLSWVFPLKELLALIVANTMLVNTYPWNIVTAHVYEGGLIKLLVDVPCVLLASRAVPAGHMDQFALYVTLTLVAAGVGASLLRLLCFSMDPSQEHLTKAEWGAGALVIALAMYSRIEHADSPVTPYSPLTYNHAIPLLVAANVLLSWLGIGADGAFSVFAFFFAWSYLRHLYRYPNGALGERAHETQFVKMFPAAVQPILSTATAPVERLFARLGIFGADLLEVNSGRQLPRHHLRNRDDNSPPSATAPDPVKERRMQLARKMLEERREGQAQMEISPASV